jgi:signal transduction histidine kinase
MATRRLPPVWAIASLAWLGPAFLAAFREYLQAAIEGRDGPSAATLVWEAGDWALLALLTPAVFWCARRWPLERGMLVRRIPLHFLFGVALCVAWAGAGVLLSIPLIGGPPFGMSPLSWLFSTLPFGVAVYFAMLGVEHAVFYFTQARDREHQLATARLGALRMQMQPHFLFNSLNAITVIVRDRDTATATRMLEQLGDMLRRVMRADRPMEVPLADEVDFVRQYLEIETVRFADRLRVAFAVPEALRRAAVPEFVLQPLVENAVRHAVAQRSQPTRITIAARRDGDDLVLTVTDDGPGVAPGAPEGVGLGNTRARLVTLYGTRGRLDVGATPGGGATVTVRLPYREHA